MKSAEEWFTQFGNKPQESGLNVILSRQQIKQIQLDANSNSITIEDIDK